MGGRAAAPQRARSGVCGRHARGGMCAVPVQLGERGENVSSSFVDSALVEVVAWQGVSAASTSTTTDVAVATYTGCVAGAHVLCVLRRRGLTLLCVCCCCCRCRWSTLGRTVTKRRRCISLRC